MRIIIEVVLFFAGLPQADLPPGIHVRLELVLMFAHPFLQAYGIADAIAILLEEVLRIAVHAAAVTRDGKCAEILHANPRLTQLPGICAEMIIFIGLISHVLPIGIAYEDMMLLRAFQLHRHLLDAVFRVVSGLPDRPQAFVDRQLCARQHAIPRRQREDLVVGGRPIYMLDIIFHKCAQALMRHRVAAHRFKLPLHLLDDFRIRLVAKRRLPELRALNLEVAFVRKENALGRQAVTSRVDDLLIVVVETIRHRVVQHEAHICTLQLKKRIRRRDEDTGNGIGPGIVRGQPLHPSICYPCICMPAACDVRCCGRMV